MFLNVLVFASVFSVLFLHTGSKALVKDEDKSIKLFERTFFAFEKALNFYKEEYDLVNIDSLLGLRVAQGSLQRILVDNLNVNFTFAEKYLSQIGEMYSIAGKITEKALPYVRADNVEQYEKFYKIIGKPWKVFNEFQKLNLNKIKDKNLKSIIFDGPTSDHCISLLLADSSTGGQSSCNITDYCWKFETRKNLDGYTPTHQVLYFLFGLGEGCDEVLNQKFQNTATNSGVQDFFHETCGNIFKSAREILQDTNMLEIEKDLFMEQTLVCSLTGYEDFLSETYLDIVLGWQTDIGCFGKQVSERVKRPSRTLLFERRLRDGCLVHETGVGIALLGQYMRWILETRIARMV